MATIPFNPSDFSHLSLPNLNFNFPPMRDLSLSLFLLKNSFASRMKRGLCSFCNGVGSTSTLNQGRSSADVSCVAAPSSLSESGANHINPNGSSPKTLEEMLLQLDLEEAAARRAKLEEYGELNRRMSCVNNSDILRSARNALNQYPRFSLDGRDAMYRSSFRRNFEAGRKSLSYELDVERSLRMPPTVAGECVVWCKPSVVAKLMGLDAVPVPVPVPVPVKGRRRSGNAVGSRNRNLARMGRYELEKERMGLLNNVKECEERVTRRRRSVDASSTTAAAMAASAAMDGSYCVMKPGKGCGEKWELRRAR